MTLRQQFASMFVLAVGAIGFVTHIIADESNASVAGESSVERIGRTSITLKLEVWVKPILRESASPRFKVTEAEFVFVAIDENGQPRAVPKG